MDIVNRETFQPVTSINDLAANWTVKKDIPYCDGREKDDYRQECCVLDIYYPENRKNVPVLLYFHGGGMIGGGKHMIIEETRLLNCIIVSADYRLAPRAKCPDYIEDAAMAAAWVLRHISEYNGDPENVFIYGRSAGAYLAAMLAADPQYLQHYGCSPSQMRGYMPISGQMMTHAHVREEQGIPAVTPVFDEFAPMSFVRKDFPPMLMITGETGLEVDCRPAENKLMHDLLCFNGNTTSSYYEMKSLTHGTIWNCINPWMRNFIRKYLKRD
jgi:acetyl esterase/lipase